VKRQDTITELRSKTGLRDLRDNGASSLLDEGRVLAEPPVPPALFREACERIADMLEGDDGEAWFEAEKFLKRHAPDLYDEIGMPGEPLPDFPEPSLLDKMQGALVAAVVGLLAKKPRK
jgi:hypothetical protein